MKKKVRTDREILYNIESKLRVHDNLIESIIEKLEELLNRIAVQKKELSEDIIKYGAYNV